MAYADYVTSELYYTRLLARTDIPENVILPATERLAVSSYKSGHYHEAEARLEEWKKLSDEAISSPVWQEYYFETLSAIKNYAKLRDHLSKTMEDPFMPWAIRSAAGKNLSGMDQDANSLTALEHLYAIAPEDANKKELEQWVMKGLEDKSKAEVDALNELIPSGSNLKFPYELLVFEKAVRQSEDTEYWPMSWRAMAGIIQNGQIVDKTYFTEILSKLENKYGIPRVGIALVLPISGRFQEYGWKIVRGAGAAQWEMAKAGLDVDVQVINTEAPDWVERLQNLPPWYTTIGGPISVKAFKQLNKPEFMR